MSKVEILRGNKAVAYGAKLSRVQVIPIYPITPQTTIVEYLAEFIANGELDAEYIPVEGEHTAMATAIGASLTGVRVFTSTCSQGLAYQHECVAQAPSFRTPIVMPVVNRTLGWYWSIRPDYSDIMPELNLGWLVFFVESNQECLDTVIQLYKIAENEKVRLPAMMAMDGFYLSYSFEPVEIPTQQEVDQFLPLYEAHYVVDPTTTKRFHASILSPSLHTTYRKRFEQMLDNARAIIGDIDEEFGKRFGRRYGGLVERYKCEEAEAVLVTMGSMTTAARRTIDSMRAEGKKIGLVKIRSFRPFPTKELIEMGKNVRAMGVVDRVVCHGMGGKGGMANGDVKASLYDLDERPKVINFIAGMGGADISLEDFDHMARKTWKIAKGERVGKPVRFIEHPTPTPSPQVKMKKMLYYPGSAGCSGCGAQIIARHVLETLGENTIFVVPPSCVAPNTRQGRTLGVPRPLANYAATAGYMTGFKRGLKVKGKAANVHVVSFAGDGGTADIGLQSLSGACERKENLIWICYDNEAYMNTGVQRSGSTPLGAWTTSTPIGKFWKGKPEERKNMPLIMAAHKIPYIATASPAYIRDLKQKVSRAALVTEQGRGLAYIHIQQPCPTGWRFPSDKTIEVARLAVQTGAWPLFEIENGIVKINVKRKELKPISEYLNLQGRFQHLIKEQIAEVQNITNSNWETLLELERTGIPWY